MAIEEGQHAGEFLVSEGNGAISREVVTILSGEVLEPGTVVAKITASGKYAQLDQDAAATGQEVAAGVLWAAVDATDGDTDGVIIARMAEVKAADLVWPADIEAGEKVTALGELEDLNIIAR